MKTLGLTFLFAGALVLASACSSSPGTTTPDAAVSRAVDAAPPVDAPSPRAAVDTGAGDSPVVDAAPVDGGGPAARGQYLVGVLGCNNCHTPQVNGMADTTMRLSGRDCFVATPVGSCLSSANLTDDPSGIKTRTDREVIDAIRTGKSAGAQDGGMVYLFDNMPYYTYANLSDGDAAAIVAYLRSLPPINHTVTAASGVFATRPTAAQSAPVTLAELPSATPTSEVVTSGKYLAALVCLNCHTVPATADGGAVMPRRRDAAKAFQGGQAGRLALDGGVMMFTSANLTPDMTGLRDWTRAEVVTAIKTAKDRMGRMLCPPMRANAAITEDDAGSIADYLRGIPPAVSMQTTCNGP